MSVVFAIVCEPYPGLNESEEFPLTCQSSSMFLACVEFCLERFLFRAVALCVFCIGLELWIYSLAVIVVL